MSLAVHDLYKKTSFASYYSLQQLIDQKEEGKIKHTQFPNILFLLIMEFSKSFNTQALVKTIKEELLSDNNDPYSFIAPSAYDTAWLAMVPDMSEPCQPMFKNCLDWVLNNQNVEGFWGEYDGHGMPTIECLPATIACMIALKRWKAGEMIIDKGNDSVQTSIK